MSGWMSTIFSPSRVTTRRSTPWVLGCWGPMLSSSSSVRSATPAAPPGSTPRLGLGRDRAPQEGFDLDLVLELQDALDQRLGPRRTAGHVDVYGHDLIDPLEDRIVVVVERPAAGPARSHGQHVLGLGHLLPQPPYDRRHLDGAAAGHDHEISLPRRGAWN